MNKIHGVIYALAAAVFFGIMPIWVKIAYSTGLTAYDAFFLRGLFAGLILLAIIKSQKISLKLDKKQIKILLVGGVIGYVGGILSLYISYEFIPVGVATALHFLFPMTVALFSFFFFKEKLHRNKWAALGVALIGMFTMTSFNGGTLHPMGIFWGVFSAVTFSIYVLALNNEAMKRVHSYVLAFYVCVISAVVGAFMITVQGGWPLNLTGKGLFYIGLVAFFCTSVALICFIRGVQIIGPSTSSILSTLEPLVSIVAGILILNEAMTTQILIGSILVILAILIIAVTDASTSKAKESSEKL